MRMNTRQVVGWMLALLLVCGLAGCEWFAWRDGPRAWVMERSETNATKWFGGDDRAAFAPRNVGVGQSVTFSETRHVETFSFLLSGPFEYVENPDGAGHEATLALDVRLASGAILNSYTLTLPASFDGGWVTFAVSETLFAEHEYVMTCYLVDGGSLGFCTGVRGFSAEALEPELYPEGQGYSAIVYTEGGDLGAWEEWDEHPWDFCFRASGTIPEEL